MSNLSVIQVVRLLSLCLVLLLGTLLMTSFLLLTFLRQEDEAPTEQIGCGYVDYGPGEYDDFTLMDSTQWMGKLLFEQNCLTCHSPSDEVVVGPGLRRISERRDKQWIIEWVRNPQQVLRSGDQDALKLYKRFNKLDMPAFTNLSEADIMAIVSYVERRSF